MAKRAEYTIYRIGEWFYDYDICFIASASTKEKAIDRVEHRMKKFPGSKYAIVHISKEEKFLAEQKQKQSEWREEQRAKSKAERKAMRFSKDVENAYYKTSYKAGHLI